MATLEAELERARALDPDALADAVAEIGFECTRCGACCKAAESDGDGGADAGPEGDTETNSDAGVEEHTATIFPDEVRTLQAAGGYDWRDVARPVPFGLDDTGDSVEGETFEWALQTDCGDCTFYAEDGDGTGECTVHDARPLICRTYPFSVVLGSEASEGSSPPPHGALTGTSQPMGAAVEAVGDVRAHECEGLGRDIARGEAEELAAALKERAVRELEEAIAVRGNYEPVDSGPGEVVVHDSEGAKHPDGTPFDEGSSSSGRRHDRHR
jgi:Fe-S-cluster containining protein